MAVTAGIRESSASAVRAALTGGKRDVRGMLFAAALRSGPARIVVKRPRLAPPLRVTGAPPVTSQLPGRSSRFDVYVLPRG